MRVVLTVGGLAGDFGGPSRSVPALAVALGRLGIDVDLITAASSGSEGPPLLPTSDRVRTHVLPQASRTTWLPRANAFATLVRACCSQTGPLLIHDQGLWLASNHAVAVAARQTGRPLVISPRGMLAPWSLSQKSAKKRLAWWLYQHRDLVSASALHATSKAELEDCRRAGYSNAIAVIANGTELPPASGEDHTSAGQRPSAGPVRTVLCLSRIHPVKGIALLIQAWARLRPAGWRLLIAGRDEGSHSVELTRLIADHGLHGSVEMVGAVDGDAKWTLIRSADLFVLPSHSESFGMVVAEALACEVPVITTRGTPWAELEEARCGWWIDRGVDPLTVALQTAFDLPAADRRQMGVRGRQLIETRFTWNAVAREMAAFYEWCLNPQSAPPPSLADCRR